MLVLPIRLVSIRNSAFAAGLLALTLVAAGCRHSATPTPTTMAPTIQPLTHVVVSPMAGYFPDPLPIHFAAGSTAPQAFAGSNRNILVGTGGQAGSFQTTRIAVELGTLPQQAKVSGTTVRATANHNIYQDNQGAGKWRSTCTC